MPGPEPPAPRRTTRLAPSPTGALHLGNVRTLLITWALARARGWRVVMRIEDLDTPRVRPGQADALAGTLAWLGIDWDEPEGGGYHLQSRDIGPCREALRRLAAAGLAYPCTLTRAQIELAASAPQEGAHDVPFPRELRPPMRPRDFDAAQAAAGPEGTNWRFAVPDAAVTVHDAFVGARTFDVGRLVGDFVLWTKRGLPSYQLAVVVDDHRQHVTDVVRGDDLLDSAARQLLLSRALDLRPEPGYLHLPLVVGPDGRRLAKRHGDTRVDHYRALGVPAEAFVGLVAAWSGVLPREAPAPMSPAEFVGRLLPDSIPREPVVFRPEDDQWLRSCAR
ncbi:MAG TPA: glutamate--tRNA ligase family protein [Phycisphaerales bacterium]|nr:glutamate--tRNA ligase family protein [Phycisphaerales bacterium]